MESSSDESFTWGKVSNDSEDSTDSSSDSKNTNKDVKDELYGNLNGNTSSTSPSEEKLKKRKLKKEAMSSEESCSSPRKKKLKTEPNIDVKKQKRKKECKDDLFNSTEQQMNEDESFLSTKVELENSENHNTKKERKRSLKYGSDDVNTSNELSPEIFVDKKLKKKNKHADIENESFTHVIEKSPKKKHKIRESTTQNSNNDEIAEETATEVDVNDMQSVVINNDQIGNENKVIRNNNWVHYVSEESLKSKEKKKHLHNGIENINKSIEKHESNTRTVSKKKHNKSTILDRITFEDDVESNMELSQSKNVTFEDNDKSNTEISRNKIEYSLKIKNYLRANSVLQPITNDIECCSDITSDYELWVIKCPHEIEANSFSNKDFALDSKSKIKINGVTYCGTLDDQISNITIMSKDTNKSSIKNVKISGVLSLRKRLRKPHFVEDNMIQNHNAFIPLPETKPRHPLFGSNYQKAIKVPSSLLQRLRQDTAAPVNYNKKKKKTKKEHNLDMDKDNMVLKEPKVEVADDSPVRKIKKRKHDSDEEVPIKKAKRKKKESKVNAEDWESEKAIEENLFNF